MRVDNLYLVLLGFSAGLVSGAPSDSARVARRADDRPIPPHDPLRRNSNELGAGPFAPDHPHNLKIRAQEPSFGLGISEIYEHQKLSALSGRSSLDGSGRPGEANHDHPGNGPHRRAQAYGVQPVGPMSQPEPKQPETEPKQPETEPKQPETEPKQPETEPKQPETEPEEPETPSQPGDENPTPTGGYSSPTGGYSNPSPSGGYGCPTGGYSSPTGTGGAPSPTGDDYKRFRKYARSG